MYRGLAPHKIMPMPGTHKGGPADHWQRRSFPKVIFISKVSAFSKFTLYLPTASDHVVMFHPLIDKIRKTRILNLHAWVLLILVSVVSTSVESKVLSPINKAFNSFAKSSKSVSNSLHKAKASLRKKPIIYPQKPNNNLIKSNLNYSKALSAIREAEIKLESLPI